MGMRHAAGLVAVATLGVSVALLPGSPASAKGRPCGRGVSTSGTGSLGSPFTLKSMHDDMNGAPVVGEEFEINVPAGQVWRVTFADNGLVFFDADSTAGAGGIREVHATANQAGTQHMTAHAVSRLTGEVVDASVDLPPPPTGCSGH